MLSNEKWFGASAPFYDETIDQSLRFEDGDSPRLSKTFGSGGDRKNWTWSAWVKRGNISSTQMLFHTFATAGFGVEGYISFSSSDSLDFQFDYNGGTRLRLITNRLFRDTTNFYHICVVADSDNATQGDRLRIYVNGIRETSFSTESYPSNTTTDGSLNSAYSHYISGRTNNTVFFDGYLAEVNFLDGVAVTDTSGVLDELVEIKNGVCIPKEYSGSYGTTGFRFTFADSSSLGDDTSGNTNDFATGGTLASTDVSNDSPTNNFCTLNPNFRAVTANTLSEGNLKCVTSSAGRSFNAGSFLMTPNSGKWYWEFKVDASSGGMGVAKTNGDNGAYQSATSTSTSAGTTDYYYGETVFSYYSHAIRHNGSLLTSLSGSAPSPLIYGIGVDMDASPPTITYYVGGSSVGSANLDTGYDYIPIAGDGSGAVSRTINVNFGQDDTFAGTETSVGNTDSNGNGLFHDAVPSGYLALCSSNLPDTTLSPNQSEQATDYFNTRLYTGDNQTTQAITGVGFQPDWLWIKERTSTSDHVLLDSNRGASKFLVTSSTNGSQAENTATTVHQSFDPDGFTVGSSGATNENGQTYASWNWLAGGTAVSNTVGDISASVSVNPDSGFSIVTYTGTGTNTDTVGHGLGAKPKMVFVKSRSEAQNWHVYHEGVDATAPHNYILTLNATNARNSTPNTTLWGGTAPTTTVMGVGSDNSSNKLGTTYVMYLFAEIEGYSKFGTYTGNSSQDGAYIHCSFRPSFIMIKVANTTGQWFMLDNKRDGFNGENFRLLADSTSTEYTGSNSNILDIYSNGFKLRQNSQNYNQGYNYVYMAFAEQPFKFSNSR